MTRATCLIAFVPALAAAAGWTDLQGENSKGETVVLRHVQTITVQRQGEEQAYVQHVKADIIVRGHGARRTFPAQDCLHSTRPDGEAWLSCSSLGTSPLAGTTYRQPPPQGSIPPWACSRNCGASAPLVLRQSDSRGSDR